LPLDKVKHIVSNIKKGEVKPIYFLMGEEAYYIDALSKFIETNVLSEEEKGFNQTVFYGREIKIEDLVSSAKRFPMMAERQVIIVKEAQDLSRTIENLVSYAENPQPSTVLVICYKYKKLDKRKKIYKAIEKNGLIFESKKIYDNQIPDWIRRVLAGKGYTISPKASQMLVEFLGNDLAKINNELEKLQLIVKPSEQISAQTIEKNIGISKDYNNFELLNALANKDVKKAFGIIQYFAQDPKNHPTVVTVSTIFGFFSKVMKYHALPNKSQAPKALGVHPFFIKDYEVAARNYPMRRISIIISSIREIDVKSKGVGGNLTQGDLLKELLVSVIG
jgi:DNA polymerase-3 subunit delta